LSSSVLASSKLKLPGAETPNTVSPDSLILYGVFAVLFFAPLAFGAVEPWAIFIVEASSALLFTRWLYQQARTGTIRLRGNPLFLPMAAFGLVVLLQLIFRRSGYVHDTIESVLLYTAYLLLAVLVCQTLVRGAQARALASAISAYGLGVAVFAMLQALSGTTKLYWLRTPRLGGWIYGPYVNHNHYAGLMELLLPVPLILSLTRFAKGWIRTAAMITSALMAGTIFLSGSRGGMLALTVQLIVLAGLLLRTQRAPRAVATIGMFFAVTLGLLIWIGGGKLADRLSSVRTEARSEVTGGTRYTLNKDSLHMAAKRPLLGWGLGTFPVVYPQFRTFYTNFYVNEAHNDYLQFLVETGALGFAVLLWFIWRLYRNALGRIQEWTTDLNGSIALAGMLGCTGILVHSFVDFNLQIPANAAWFYVLAVIAASRYAVESRQRVRRVRAHHELSQDDPEQVPPR